MSRAFTSHMVAEPWWENIVVQKYQPLPRKKISHQNFMVTQVVVRINAIY